ncbi:MAG: carbon starvation protein A [Rhodospirillaceae bacterium]|nr:MAG: carbon starvation protein A [Rhodospirillaceae bacterium]
MRNSIQVVLWALVCAVGAAAFAVLALRRGESVSAVWLLVAALTTYAVGYRFYSRYIAVDLLALDDGRLTPAVRHADGLDYVATPTPILFGHHFAAIAGAGPLVGPVLAAQMGYLPGTLWILVGAVLAGCVQDFVILVLSVRRDGRSLGQMISDELGRTAGIVALIGVFAIMVILLAVLAMVVVKALAQSPWGTFAVAMTIPIALFMGVYLRFIRPGRIGEVSIIGFVLLMLALWGGAGVAADPPWAELFTLDGRTLAWLLMGYGFVAAVLPVWLLLAPRDYLSTFLKVGTIALLAVGIVIVMPALHMPAVTRFVDGSGPVFSGSLFPFLFITIACGAVSGFHALISSGTTPKMVDRESATRFIGYGAMVMESFVAIMALTAACALEPGLYFALNSPSALIGGTVDQAAQVISDWGFTITPDALAAAAQDVGEKTILSRTGGAPTLAVGMARILSHILGGGGLMAFWYHFAILFEALFILTTIDAGTRVARFMTQDLLGLVSPRLGRTTSFAGNLLATGICVAGWGWFLYRGVIDPLGGINTLWPLFGIANQMLAAIALTLATVVFAKAGRGRSLLVTLVPSAWLLVCTLTAAAEKLFHSDPRISFLAHAKLVKAAIADGRLLAPAKDAAQMTQLLVNDIVNAGMCALFAGVVIAMVIFGLRAVRIGIPLADGGATATVRA